MKKYLIIVLITCLFLTGCSNSESSNSTDSEERYVDQRLTGNWELSDNSYLGNTYFNCMTITFDENGICSINANALGTDEIVDISGSYSVDGNGNLYINQTADGEILYYYSLVDGYLILQYDESDYGSIRLSKINETQITNQQSTEQQEPVTPVSVDIGAGMYEIGTDIPPGKYDITAISGHGNFFGRPGIVNELMGVDDDYYIINYNNANFENGDQIEIKGTLVVNLTSK